MNQLSQINLQRYCDNCSRPFVVPRSAPHKRFCCIECRNKWNYLNRTPDAKRRQILEPPHDLENP